MIASKINSVRGYSILKSDVSDTNIQKIVKELTVTPAVPQAYIGTVNSFKVYLESATRYYLPNAWGRNLFGPGVETRPEGESLPSNLIFQGSLRSHQTEALAKFAEAGNNGIICLPCGYGKTFTGIAAALRIGKCFMIVVHKEFLASQWTSELQTLVPGIRIGRIQGEKCTIDNVDCVIVMIQTLCSRHYPAGTFSRFGFAIFDEVHHLGAEHFSGALTRINCRTMLGLTATPKRIDGLTKVFLWHLGPICYEITRRPKDDCIYARCLRYSCDDPVYADVKCDFKGEPIRALMINQIAEYKPRTKMLVEWILPFLEENGRRLLILSDRREHLADFEKLFHTSGIKPEEIGYYVGGMKQKSLHTSADCRIILGTFAMASEGMNIPALNTVLLATPKSNVEQSVGRILRLKKEERIVTPLILDVLDTAFVQCNGQWIKRRKFYKECGYIVRWSDEESEDDCDTETLKESKGKPLFIEED
jgi:superfamily II DNA or RNA helicase